MRAALRDTLREAREAHGRLRLSAVLDGLRTRRRFARRRRALVPEVVVAARDPVRGAAPLGVHVVHWNAPDFLRVNLARLAALHPEAPVTVLDNGSGPDALRAATVALGVCPRATLLRAQGDKPRHTLALQVLLDRAHRTGESQALFLDQDAMLLRRVDALGEHLAAGALLVGARDEVVLPRTDGPLRAGHLRAAPAMVHASFLLLEPQRLVRALGPTPFVQHPLARLEAEIGGWQGEPYHGLAVRCRGRIVYLESRVSATLPPLTQYELGGVAYACHAWYSSRAAGLGDHECVDGLPVAWLRARRAAVLAWMQGTA